MMDNFGYDDEMPRLYLISLVLCTAELRKAFPDMVACSMTSDWRQHLATMRKHAATSQN